MEFNLPFSPTNNTIQIQRIYKPQFIYYGKRYINKKKKLPYNKIKKLSKIKYNKSFRLL